MVVLATVRVACHAVTFTEPLSKAADSVSVVWEKSRAQQYLLAGMCSRIITSTSVGVDYLCYLFQKTQSRIEIVLCLGEGKSSILITYEV